MPADTSQELKLAFLCMEEYIYGGRAWGRTHATAKWYDLHPIGHIEANRIVIPPDAQLNTSIYEEAEVVYED